MNSFTSAYDPHTDYFSPIAKANFQIDMSHSLEGIGARLTQQLDLTKVADIIPGGPAYRSKELMKDDKIIGVAQGESGEFIDVIGWRLDEVVQKIRGPKGTTVR
jgi:carboxyl-terminal processing protease